MLQSITPLLGILALAVAAGAGLVVARPPPTEEPLADFDHAAHIERGVGCEDCHVGLQDDVASARAGTPSIKICLELCHADFEDDAREAMRRTANGRHVLEHMLAGEEPWWPRAYAVPHHVVFSHRRHVGMGKLECESCHGDIASARTLPREPVTDRGVTMDGCMECHAERGASNDCFACHR